MDISYRKAQKKDIETVLELRHKVLMAVNGITDKGEMQGSDEGNRRYFEKHMEEADKQVTYLALYGDEIVGCGSICFLHVLPTCQATGGKWGYIMNIYIRTAHRRKGIGREIVQRLLAEAKERGCGRVMLDASEEGCPLYEKIGFRSSKGEMEIFL